MATKSPPMNSMLESFRYSMLTCNKTAHPSVAVSKVFPQNLADLAHWDGSKAEMGTVPHQPS